MPLLTRAGHPAGQKQREPVLQPQGLSGHLTHTHTPSWQASVVHPVLVILLPSVPFSLAPSIAGSSHHPLW